MNEKFIPWTTIKQSVFYENYTFDFLTKTKIRGQRVNQILSLKKEDPQANTSVLEQEIDVLVYRLYGLTYEEVLVVDEDFEEVMGEEEYAAVEL